MIAIRACNKDSVLFRGTGIASCGEGENVPARLFWVMAGVPIDYALEQSSVLMSCVHRLTYVGVMENDDTLV